MLSYSRFQLYKVKILFLSKGIINQRMYVLKFAREILLIHRISRAFYIPNLTFISLLLALAGGSDPAGP